MRHSKGLVIAFWIATALFCLQMGFTAYAQLELSGAKDAFVRLGFPSYFRVELSIAKLAGALVLLAPASPRLKEWAYAGFAFNLASAVIAHVSMGDGPEAWGFAVGTSVLWAISYVSWRRLQAPTRETGADGTSASAFPSASRSPSAQTTSA